MAFANLPLDPALLRGLKDLGFTRPTPIQEKAIPIGLERRDLLACAMTGSGKTYAFLLPILHHLLTMPRGKTRALVLTPTRELAAQVLQSLEEVAVHTPLTAASIFGGVGMGPQEHAFRVGVDVIVATPGRLLDHLSKPYASLAAVEFLVLDEADRMLDMGFLPDIRRVLKHVPAKRQTLFFSATMPDPIAQLSREMLKTPATLDLERKAMPATGITQAVYPCPQDLKVDLLLKILSSGVMKQALVFTRTKHRANRLAERLAKAGVKAERIHGNRSQAQRTAALDGFRDGTLKILVGTDIIARGIDVEALGHVVNFDVPVQPEDYIHRVGRTARAGLTGEAYTFVSPDEEGDLKAIEKAVGKRLPRVTLPDFDYQKRAPEAFEIPIADRIKEIRARKAEERKRAAEKAARRAASGGSDEPRRQSRPSSPRPSSGSRPGSDSPYAGGGSSGGGGGGRGGAGGNRRRGGRGRGGGGSRSQG